MLGVAGEKCSFHARVRREPGGDPAGVGALTLDPEGQGLNAAHGEIAFKRTHDRPESARKVAQEREVRLIANGDASDNIAVAGEIFCGAVANDARAELQGTDEQRCGEGVIDDERHSGVAAKSGNLVERGHAQERVGHGLRRSSRPA